MDEMHVQRLAFVLKDMNTWVPTSRHSHRDRKPIPWLVASTNMMQDRVARDRDGVARRSQSTDGVHGPPVADEHSAMLANASAAVPRIAASLLAMMPLLEEYGAYNVE